MNTKPTTLPIIRTKLYAPSVPLDHVRRDRLLERLDQALEVPLTLVSAPAGYGKSVLVSNWVRLREQPVAWLSLDGADSDLRQFVVYILAALDGAYSRVDSELGDMLAAHELAPVPVLACHLLNHLDAIAGPCVVVLDDYHHLARGSDVHELVGMLLEHPPPNSHLVILTRRDPPLALTGLRAGSRLVEIRLQDLRFTAAETAALLIRTADLTVNEAAMANLLHELEGWAAGLRLVVLAIRSAADPEAFLTGLHGGIPQTQEYLLYEVLAGLSPADRAILLKSSILDRYCAELIDAVCAEDDQLEPSTPAGQAFVELLQQSNLFSFSLDPDGQWFRYHHLFQALLQRQLQRAFEADDIARLHLRASAWLETKGDISEAVQHALAGEAEELAADIVERHRRAALEQDRSFAVGRWFDQLPADLLRRRPELLLTQAWIAYYQFNVVLVASCVEQLEAMVDETCAEPHLLAELNYFRSFLAYWAGDGPGARDYSEQALGVFSKNPGMMAGEIMVYVVLGRQMCGESTAALEFLKAEKAASSEDMGDVYLTRLFAAESFLSFLSGQLQAAGNAAKQLDVTAKRSNSIYAQAWGEFLLALNHIHSNRLKDARQTFAQAAKHRTIVERKMALDMLAGLALANALLQRAGDALGALDEMDEFCQELRDPEFFVVVESCRARVALLLGDPEPALAWARSALLDADPAALFVWLDEPVMTQARVRIVAGEEAEVRQALECLDDLRRRVAKLHNLYRLIEIDGLRSMALSRLGRTDEARDVARTAVAQAAPGDWIRPFVELGQPMAELLADLDVKRADQDFLQRLLASFQVHDTTTASGAASARVPLTAPESFATSPALSDLTNRELDILELLSQRLQNKEIAARLFISTHTVNYHLKHIYQKLGVNGRRQAIAKAGASGLLSKA